MRRHAASRRRPGADERRPGPPPSLESPRDAGLAVRQRNTSQRRTPRWVPLVLAIVVIALAGASIAAMASKSTSRTSVSVARVWKTITSISTVATATPASEPTPSPYFASFRGVKIHLPIAATSITVLVFHQSSYNDTYPMHSLLKAGDSSRIAKAASRAKAAGKSYRSTPNAASVKNSHGVWTGKALSLWRAGRAGAAYTAADCGAKPGTAVLAPLSGTVMEIRRYKLYGKYTDIEIDIKPDAWSDIDVILLHVTNPHVTEGQHVVGGVTKIAEVRHLSGIVSGLQLRTYSTDGGNHTHLQITKIPNPKRRWVVGKDPPGMVRVSD
jgi:murein DD-endopeptidase MepM/ murein hydrolase activator NlpD